jgi:signal transduction histidine kinase
MKKRIKLRIKIFLYFGTGALLIMLFFYLFSIYISDKTFEEYKIEATKDLDNNYVSYMQEMYNNGINEDDMRMSLFMNSRQDQVYFRLYDEKGNFLWELTRQGVSGHMGQGRMGQTASDMSFVAYEIKDKDEIALIFEIGRTEKVFFSDADIAFKDNLNRGLVLISIFGIIITAIISLILSRQIAKPILKIRDYAIMIKEGEFDTKSDIDTDTCELVELSEVINSLGSNLQSQENLRIRLTSDVSHELRTPLNILQNEIEALIDGIWEPSKKRFEQCHEEIMRLTGLVSDLEKLTDITNYSLDIKKEKFDLNLLVVDVFEHMKVKFEQKKIVVDLKNQASDMNIYGDKNKIRQVLINLLSNAYKFTPEKGKVVVEVVKEIGFYRINVKDNGIGIEHKDMEHIFERFYRAENSRSRDTGGAGLGLAITKGIIEAHKGTIEVKSVLGKGTEFIVRLPFL